MIRVDAYQQLAYFLEVHYPLVMITRDDEYGEVKGIEKDLKAISQFKVTTA